MDDKPVSIEELREELAALEHLQWEEWASTLILKEPHLSKERTDRWAQYMVPYAELSEEVKGHDRVWADRILDIMRPVIAALTEKVEEAEKARAATIEVLNDCQAEMGRQCARAEQAEAEAAKLEKAARGLAESLVGATGRYRPEEEMTMLPEEHMADQVNRLLARYDAAKAGGEEVTDGEH